MRITEERRSLMVSIVMVLFFFNTRHLQVMSCHLQKTNCTDEDRKLLEFPLNLEYLEAEFFLFGALGFGLDKVAPNLTMGGPSPIGAQKANLDRLTRDIVSQFAWQEVGHLRAIKETVRGFARPLLDLSKKSFAKVMDDAFGRTFLPPFDPYANSLNYLIASYLVPYVGLTGYVGANPKLQCPESRKLVAGLLGVEAGQDAVIRTMLYAKAKHIVHPYGVSVAAFTDRISDLRNKLGKRGVKDEGLVVHKALGAEGEVAGNVLVGDDMSLAFDRTPKEILRIVYGSGSERIPGGFYPKGANGEIAKSYLA
ncbi:Desiccation-like protein [Hirschfeldia incana]|nr:Desiccation-like protein [Hirschfeldia incana]